MLERQPEAGKVKNSELISKLKTGEIQTTSIHRDSLPAYEKLALETGFKIEQIAGEEERFPRFKKGDSKIRIQNSNGKAVDEFREGISYLKVRRGFVAISVERPEGADSHRDFWEKAINVSQKKR